MEGQHIRHSSRSQWFDLGLTFSQTFSPRSLVLKGLKYVKTQHLLYVDDFTHFLFHSVVGFQRSCWVAKSKFNLRNWTTDMTHFCDGILNYSNLEWGIVSGLIPQCILKWKNKGVKKHEKGIRLCACQHGQKRRHTMAGDHRGVWGGVGGG